MATKRDPEEVIGYLDETGCVLHIDDAKKIFRDKPMPEHYIEIREKDMNSDDWEVTI